MKTLVTVDWDFFLKEDPMWDLGHRESLLFLTVLWGTREALIDEMRLTGDEAGFWDRIGVKRSGVEPLWVSDSHCMAHSLTKGVDRVVLFDAHHDCWKGDKGQVSCENWLRVWLRGSKRRKAVWVRPGWFDERLLGLPDDLKDRVDVVDGLEGLDLGLEGPVRVHVCRSGCWMPPWLDEAFLGFLEGYEGYGGDLGGVLDMQDGGWEALRPRWTKADLDAAAEEAKRVRELVKGWQREGHTILGVPSGMFQNGMVEVRA